MKALLSVPEIILFIFSLWRTITITGIAIAAMNNGHKSAKLQWGVRAITEANVRGKATEAVIEASKSVSVTEQVVRSAAAESPAISETPPSETAGEETASVEAASEEDISAEAA